MKRSEIKRSVWKPTGIVLEPAALTAVKNLTHTLVVAGPGAGKTELLAQRACFLLETGTCPPPYRILAISFKRDAAENLKARVVLRCGRELASRLDSMTFDAFGKDLLNRFRLSLPAEIRPSPDYDILSGVDAGEARLRERLVRIPDEHCALDGAARQQINGPQLLLGMTGRRLPFRDWPVGPHFIAGAGMWRALLTETPSLLTFAMVNRLGEFIARNQLEVQAALRDTYRFVFLDEFQDTTKAQCELTETCFLGSGSILTAVGDTKQRIMGWAGALPGIFQRFKDSFGADVVRLVQNHRSRSRLVEIQSVFASELDPEAVATVAARDGEATGECQVLEFANEESEANYIAKELLRLIKDGVPEEEICVLCRARPDKFADALIGKLKEGGTKVRVEVNRRETLGEPAASLLLGMLDLMFAVSAPDAWEHVTAVLSEIVANTDKHDSIRTKRKLIHFLEEQKALLAVENGTKEELQAAFERMLDFVGRDFFAALHPQYAQGDYLHEVQERLAELVATELQESGWDEVVDAVKGVGAISVMTMHKSKGLEFDTVVFLGLEDGAIWNYRQNSEEETCGLFVALSRAKERCIFTFCRTRVGRYGAPEGQSRMTLRRIYELFAQSGVPVAKID